MVAVLNGLPAGSEAAFAEAGVVPVLGTPGEAARWSALARRLGRGLPALLHVDTGMRRLGFSPAEFAALAGRLDGIVPRFAMTHLVSSEVPEDPINAVQAARFAEACAAFPGVARSFANSSGMFLGPGFGSDLARPGAALYGINPVPSGRNPMRPVVRLSARVLALRDVPAGEGVGYNATWIARRDSRIATLGVGYADGWHRSHSGRGHAIFDGALLPLVGRVSMDLTTFDATDLPALTEGAWVELIGPGRPVDDVAAAAGTNGYEVLTSLGRRYARVYSA
jgi:alanine racemase